MTFERIVFCGEEGTCVILELYTFTEGLKSFLEAAKSSFERVVLGERLQDRSCERRPVSREREEPGPAPSLPKPPGGTGVGAPRSGSGRLIDEAEGRARGSRDGVD